LADALNEMSIEAKKQEQKEHDQFPGGEKGVDLAFVIDCTSSMAPWVAQGDYFTPPISRVAHFHLAWLEMMPC
jgi:hypothetical protein